jgi:hypothetical protein
MTIVSEINAIVTENGGTASTDGTIIGALDALADTLAGENVERQNSITKAIEALAPYISGGSFGPLQSVIVDHSMPEVGNTLLGWMNMLSISSGDIVYAQGNVISPSRRTSLQG